tara:strand:- start:206 stop:391 length:186 start_codon:yes stop_codon:yes gene_type:complete
VVKDQPLQALPVVVVDKSVVLVVAVVTVLVVQEQPGRDMLVVQEIQVIHRVLVVVAVVQQP